MMMEAKRKFGERLRDKIKSSHHIFAQEKIETDDYQVYLRDIENIWTSIPGLTEYFYLEIMSQGKKLYFLRTLSKEEKKEKEMARIPLEVTQEGKGEELLQLTWLLIIESLDQLFARRLEKEKGQLHLDRLINFQETEYKKLLQQEGDATDGSE